MLAPVFTALYTSSVHQSIGPWYGHMSVKDSKLLILMLARTQGEWTYQKSYEGQYRNCCFWPGHLFSVWSGKARFESTSLKWSNRHREAQARICHSPSSSKSRPLTWWYCYLGRLTELRTMLSLSLFRFVLFQKSSCSGHPNQPHHQNTHFYWVFQISFK